MKEILAKLVEGKDLTKEEAMKAQELILTGQSRGLGDVSKRQGNRGADCMFSDSTPHERGNAG